MDAHDNEGNLKGLEFLQWDKKMLFPHMMIFYSKFHLACWIIMVVQKNHRDFWLLLFDKKNQLVTIISPKGNSQGCYENVKQILME